jgi:hypothetical protein
MSMNLSIRELLVAVERSKGITLRRHSTLDDLAHSLLYRWPEGDRGDEWIAAQAMCLEAMEGVRDPEQARAAFVAAAEAAGMLMVREEHVQQRNARQSRTPNRRHFHEISPSGKQKGPA